MSAEKKLRPQTDPETAKVLGRLLGFHEALRRLDVPPKDLYVKLERGMVVFMAVQGKRTFTAECGKLRIPPRHFLRAWSYTVEWWNSGDAPQAEYEEIYGSFIRDLPPAILLARVLEKGFVIAPVKPTQAAGNA